MTSLTYDVSIPGQQWCNQEVVGEFAYRKNLDKLVHDLSIKERKEEFFTAELVPEPDNPHSQNGHAISVRWRNQVIGYLPEEDSARYQQIRRIIASGFTPVTHARLWFYTNHDGDRDYYIRLSLCDPDFLAPLNDPPQEGWTLLPHGSTVQVTKESDHFDVLLDFVPPSGIGQLLVTLHLFTAGVRVRYEAVEVRLDGERIGELSKQTSGKYALAVRHFNDLGLTTVSRATIKGSSLSAEVTLQSAKAHELSEEDLEPEIAPLPRLVPFCVKPTEYEVPDAYVEQQTERFKKRRFPTWSEIDHSDDDPDSEPPKDIDVVADEPPVPGVAGPSAEPKPTPPSPPSTSVPIPAEEKTQPSIKVSDFYVDGKVSGAAVLNAARKVPNKSGILLWCGVAFAVMCAIAGLGFVSASALAGTGYIVTGAGVAVACGWPLRCRNQDKKALMQWQQEQAMNQELSQYLTEEDRALLSGFNEGKPPARVPRQWKKAAPIAAILIIAGFTMTTAGLPALESTTTTGVYAPS